MKKFIITSVIIVLAILVGLVLWPRRQFTPALSGTNVAKGFVVIEVPSSYRFTHIFDGRNVAAPTAITYLGIVDVSDHAPTRFDLGHGKACVLTYSVHPCGEIQIDVTVEEKDSQGEKQRFTAPQTSILESETFSPCQRGSNGQFILGVSQLEG
jgi:hypothetical protein